MAKSPPTAQGVPTSLGAKQHVFVAQGIKRIREWDAEIKVCKKMTWAILPNGKRCLLGSTAFFTLAAAQRRKLAELYKVADNKALADWWSTHDKYHYAVRQLAEYKASGTLH